MDEDDESTAALLALWRDFFDDADVELDDSFFSLGGNSLMAVALVRRMKDELSYRITLKEFFRAPTVRAVAGAVQKVPVEESVPGSRPRWRAGVVQELTYRGLVSEGMAQARFLVTTVFRIRGPLRSDALDTALSVVVERHPILRARLELEPDGSRVYQVVDPAARGRLEVVKAPDPIAWAERVVAEGFPLNETPLFRMLLARVANDDHLLVAVLDHLAGDAWAMQVLLHEVSHEYARATGEPRPALPPPMYFDQWADAQRSFLDSPAGAEALEYWRRALPREAADLNVLLPGFGAGDGEPSGGVAGTVHAATVPATMMEAVRDRARDADATLFGYLLAGLVLILAEESGAHRLTVLTNIANRAEPGSDTVVGSLTNAALLSVDLAGVESFAEVLHRTRSTVTGAIAHQQPPMISVRRHVWPETFREYRDERRCYFVVNESWYQSFDLPGLAVEEQSITERLPERAGLEWWCRDGADGLHIDSIYRRGDYAAGYLTELGTRLARILTQTDAADELARKVGAGQA